jgi:acyl-CoA thioesterase YciA
MLHDAFLPCEITSHRLVLPADANHHGTLYAGSLLRYALEAAYAAASRAVGPAANLMLRRVISLECRRSVPIGSLVEIRGAVVQVRQAYLAVGVVGMPLDGHTLPWMDGLLGFVQVDEAGLPVALPGTVDEVPGDAPLWQPLTKRLEKLGQVKGATAEWIGAGFGG